MKPGFSFLLLPLFLILPLQEIDVFWFPFFVTVTPAEDCVPKFFRVYMPGISGDDLELPVCFNSFLPKPLPKHVTVKSIYGKTWRMALRRCGGDAERYMLLNGWKRIAKDESLTTGNVLEFQLDDDGSMFYALFCDDLQRIPSKVINDYGLSFSEAESLNIIDPLVKKFGKLTKKIKVQTNGSVFIKGYGAIYRRNGVRSTDKMICELKKAGNNNVVHTIKFHVIK
ncbi:hypothetical protein HID58_004798 [Brassica napus]|uniref:TF-B3 domain-containing protein n=1 Tax=Brassica napus TaxID=3708 RepID=A0ABQ8E6U5_BRANA|nr:hypothetical protein HID58_004798 [Brassica napus]